MSDLPKRRHELTLTIGADTFDDLVMALEHVTRELDDTGNNSVTGGPSWGGHWEHLVRPEQTHDRYFEQIEAWKAAQEPKP
jgi:hypothetical protein